MIEVNLKKMPIVVLNHYKTKSFQLAVSEEHFAALGHVDFIQAQISNQIVEELIFDHV